MRRISVLALAALALLGVVAPDALAQPATPKFSITGLIDSVGTYTRNFSSFDGSLARNNDVQFYGRTRGRFDFIGEVGKAKAVLGIEIDEYWGQTGFGDSNGAGSTTCVTGATGSVACGTQGSGAESSFDLNTDTQANLQIKWLYVEFPLPLIPVPTVARLGGQPFGGAANYKLATYANGDFGGVNIVSTITPNVKLLFTYVAVEELLTGKKDITASSNIAGGNNPQSRGDDLAFIVSAEVTPIKGLDLKPMYSYFYANGVTSANARQGRGGYSIAATNTAGSPFAPRNISGADGVGTGIGENRHTVGLDARWRSGPFSFDPTVMYQFGNREAVPGLVTPFAGVPSPYGNPGPCSALSAPDCGKQRATLNAWLVDLRAGFQLGPLLLQGMGMYTTGNKAKDTLAHNINFFQPLDTDTSYMADWGTQITSLGVDYYQILQGAAANAGLNPGVAIGYDKYGRAQVGVRASYALTPALSFGGGWSRLWTAEKVDTDSLLIGNAGLLPSFVDKNTGLGARPEGESRLIGDELNLGLTWRFADGLAFDLAGGYLFAGNALGHRHVGVPYCQVGQTAGCTAPDSKDRKVNDVILTTARVRFTF